MTHDRHTTQDRWYLTHDRWNMTNEMTPSAKMIHDSWQTTPNLNGRMIDRWRMTHYARCKTLDDEWHMAVTEDACRNAKQNDSRRITVKLVKHDAWWAMIHNEWRLMSSRRDVTWHTMKFDAECMNNHGETCAIEMKTYDDLWHMKQAPKAWSVMTRGVWESHRTHDAWCKP